MKKTLPVALVLVIALTLLVVGSAQPSRSGTAGKLTALDQGNFDDIDVSFTAIAGQGAAHLQLRQAPDDVDPGTRTFHVEGTLDIHGALPDASYRVARAVDLNDVGTPNGLCPALGAPSLSWRPVSGMLSTSLDGSGALHFVIAPPRPTPFVSGVSFDVQWQIVKVNTDGSLDPSQELRSECFTVTVK